MSYWTRVAKPRTAAADAEFMSDVQESLLAQTTPGSTAVLYLIGTLLVVALAWASFARVEEITLAEAEVISLSREQVIQSLEGGILAQMLVHEGDVVEPGQTLLRLDSTRAQANYREGLSKVVGLHGAISRLKAEAYQTVLVFDDVAQQDPAVIAQETLAYNARRRALSESVASLQNSYQLSASEIRLAAPLAAKGLLSQVELLRMKRQANDIRAQIVERQNKYQADANSELARLELELSQITENLVGRANVVEHTTLTAPVRGTVKNIRVNTVGGVIQPGEKILEIVPLEDKLLVEGKVRPADVAFLHPGLPATVKVTAYDYAIYGGLSGTIDYISPGALDEEKASSERASKTYYRVLVVTDRNSLRAGDKELPIIPGMTASVEIRTGEKTILDYLLKPVLKAREAFRER